MDHGAPQRDRAAATAADTGLRAQDLHSVWMGLEDDARALGFSQIAVADVDLRHAEAGFLAWLQAGFAGQMDYMARHGLKRFRPAELVPGTVRVITARMDYLPSQAVRPTIDSPIPSGPPNALEEPAPAWQAREWQRLSSPHQATVSLYARGRDYHKVLRQRLVRLAECLQARVGPLGHRAFTDSAPVAEVELAQRSGLGWRGKHTLALNRDGGSMFFLGEIFVDLPLPLSPPIAAHCGHCTACLNVCPTGAIVAPYRLDARRCISYLTIEHPGPIDLEWRPLMGNRIYGCDDCQLACPWNKYARISPLPDFQVRPALQDPELLGLWAWSESDFLRHTEGSAIRRIGYGRWRRNLAVALGNGLAARTQDPEWAAAARTALQAARNEADDLVREHIDWALAQGPLPPHDLTGLQG